MPNRSNSTMAGHVISIPRQSEVLSRYTFRVDLFPYFFFLNISGWLGFVKNIVFDKIDVGREKIIFCVTDIKRKVVLFRKKNERRMCFFFWALLVVGDGHPCARSLFSFSLPFLIKNSDFFTPSYQTWFLGMNKFM